MKHPCRRLPRSFELPEAAKGVFLWFAAPARSKHVMKLLSSGVPEMLDGIDACGA
jgi:hypothetical protein